MKKIKILVTGIMVMLLPALIFAQDAQKKTEVIYIQTSAQCGECKQRIETAVKSSKGIKKADLNLTDSKIMVEYMPTKTSPEKIKEVIAKSGYDADDVKADASAYQALPMCCKKEAGKH